MSVATIASGNPCAGCASPVLRFVAAILLGACILSGCQSGYGDIATVSPAAGMGRNPVLPLPRPGLIPTVNIAPAIGWPAGAKPVAPEGFSVEAFAVGLDHPRWLYVLPNGDVLVAETNAPPKPDDNQGLRGWIMGLVMRKAGATVPSANRISLLRPGSDGTLVAQKSAFLQGLNSPFGMALVDGYLYVADTDKVLRFPYKTGQTAISESGTNVLALPAGRINHHWTKNVIASPDGKHLYITVGSNSNVGENGMQHEVGRAAIWELDLLTGKHRVYASGLRNPVGMAWQPHSQRLWVSVNERDEIGSDLVPDYMTAVQEGGFYGWPYSYYGQHTDQRVKPPRTELVASAIVPDYALGAHTASLGLTFYAAGLFPESYRDGAFVGQHGSWNRRPHSGYKVIFVPFRDGQPSGEAQDFLTGFLSEEQQAYGRPVGVAVDRQGALLVADDVGNVIWRVAPSSRTAPSQ
jgi:glucose/arabinose dehydrogenase